MRKKHSLVVGGTRGTGKFLVNSWAKENHIISVIGRRQLSEVEQQNPHVSYYLVDLLDSSSLTQSLEAAITKNGKLSHLIFFQQYRGTEDDWIGQIETSLTATRNIIEALVDKFEAISEKSIVIISSVASQFVAKEQPLSYHVAKAGLNQMVRFYATVLGAKGIRVNCISPATVLKEESKDFYLDNEPLYHLYQKITPLGRMGTSEDIAQAVEFLCSAKSSFITGQNLIVDGGISLQWHESLARQLTPIDN